MWTSRLWNDIDDDEDDSLSSAVCLNSQHRCPSENQFRSWECPMKWLWLVAAALKNFGLTPALRLWETVLRRGDQPRPPIECMELLTIHPPHLMKPMAMAGGWQAVCRFLGSRHSLSTRRTPSSVNSSLCFFHSPAGDKLSLEQKRHVRQNSCPA